MMKVVYAIKKVKDDKPFCLIFDAINDGNDQYIIDNFHMMGGRPMDALESLQAVSCTTRRYRVYQYPTVQELVDDEAIVGIITPEDIVLDMTWFAESQKIAV
jgi:hypothetical protein